MPITTFPDGSGTSIWGGIAGTLSNQTDLQDALDAKANVTCLVYTALLTQTGTDAPVATVLENTLGGTVVWTYNAVGKYIATLAGAFPSGRVWTSPPTGGDYDWLDLRRADDDSLRLETAIPNFALGDYTNGLLFSYSITILVYP